MDCNVGRLLWIVDVCEEREEECQVALLGDVVVSGRQQVSFPVDGKQLSFFKNVFTKVS